MERRLSLPIRSTQTNQGGNQVKVIPATGETIGLHAYWDGSLGSYSTPQGAVMDAIGESDNDCRKPIQLLRQKPTLTTGSARAKSTPRM